MERIFKEIPVAVYHNLGDNYYQVEVMTVNGFYHKGQLVGARTNYIRFCSKELVEDAVSKENFKSWGENLGLSYDEITALIRMNKQDRIDEYFNSQYDGELDMYEVVPIEVIISELNVWSPDYENGKLTVKQKAALEKKWRKKWIKENPVVEWGGGGGLEFNYKRGNLYILNEELYNLIVSIETNRNKITEKQYEKYMEEFDAICERIESGNAPTVKVIDLSETESNDEAE